MSSAKPRNGCLKAKRISKQSEKFRSIPNFIATIDFGTTHCSVSYVAEANVPQPLLLKRSLISLDERRSKRVPSCILFNSDGKVCAFGYKARSEYASLSLDERLDYAYFEHVKKKFSMEENLDRNRRIGASNGKSYYLLDVIAHILCYLKEMILKEMREYAYRDIKPTDIDWVITVPAIWSARGKKMMREAGYKAGLCDSDITVENLTTAGIFLAPIRHIKNPDKLSLALEPESAAIQCMTAYKDISSSEKASLSVQNYLIVDCGGGTVDIATHRVLEGNVEELAPAVGNYQGGTVVNSEFKSFLGELVDDPDFEKFLDDEPAKKAQKQANLDKLFFNIFEHEKINFGNDWRRSYYPIDFPNVFAKHFAAKIVEKCEQNIDIRAIDDGWTIRLSSSIMARFFAPCIQKIGKLIIDHIKEENLTYVIDIIFWVGSFGGCNYLREQLEEQLGEEFLKKFQFSTPVDPHLAIINGATAFRLDPSIVQKRCADATYGIGIQIPFDQDIHKPNYCENDLEVPGKKWCKHIFSCMVEKDDLICTNEVFTTTLYPHNSSQSSCTFTLYSAPYPNVWYTTDQGVKKLAELVLNIAGSGRDREMEVILDMTHTEIQVCARDKQTGKEEKMVADFLSSV